MKVSVFQFAHILDYWQATTTNRPSKCWVFQDLFINATFQQNNHKVNNKSLENLLHYLKIIFKGVTKLNMHEV